MFLKNDKVHSYSYNFCKNVIIIINKSHVYLQYVPKNCVALKSFGFELLRGVHIHKVSHPFSLPPFHIPDVLFVQPGQKFKKNNLFQ